MTHVGRTGCAPGAPPPGLAASPAPAGGAGGPQRREHLQNKASGRDRASPPPPPPPPRGSRAADPEPTGAARRPSGAPGDDCARRPGSGGGGGLRSAKLPPTPTSIPTAPARSLCLPVVLLLFRPPELSLSPWEGGLALPTLAAGGAGDRALQRSCYGLPGRLPWVTGPGPAGSLPASQSPPQPPPAERPGGRRRERACAGRGAGECARAAGAPQPTGGRGCSGGSAAAGGEGAQL
ncbi:translation initiation factor IF-2-like [Vulpes lagopus]|uniref:translation initiation factor IF-2-like n=1 Tax=Vulpes lagopus TaxID=494514 RepID=UPI001BC9964B|nr:translation initiation factor IF-2-like [Vulpes lagopus]